MNARLITHEDLRRHLPSKLAFQGRVLKLVHIRRARTLNLEAIANGKRRIDIQYVAYYGIENERFGGALYIERAPRECLPQILRKQLRTLYWDLVYRTRTPKTV